MWKLVRNKTDKDQDKKATILEMDKVLGLNVGVKPKKEKKAVKIPSEVQELLMQREQARKDEDFALSDELRERIAKLGYKISDSAHGQVIDLTK